MIIPEAFYSLSMWGGDVPKGRARKCGLSGIELAAYLADLPEALARVSALCVGHRAEFLAEIEGGGTDFLSVERTL